MKKLLILSGKGGTGKTTTAGAFIDFGKVKSFADCDVDAPNLHIITKMIAKPDVKEFNGLGKSKINFDKCIGCGKCQEVCRFNAIKKMENNKREVREFSCEGCGACLLVCPVDAIHMEEDVCGELTLYKDRRTFSTAKQKMGAGNSGKIVSEVKQRLFENLAKETDLIVIDGSPGIGCPVIASISGVDMVLIVAEPTHSGISDMERIINTAKGFGVSVSVCVNKADTNEELTSKIKTYCQENNLEFVGSIPYDKTVMKALSNGDSVSKYDCPARSALKKVYTNITNLL